MRLCALALLTVLLPSAAFADTAVPVAPTVPALPVPAGAVMILSPGTADLAGYRVVIAPSGDSAAIDGAGRGQRQLSPQLVKTLFADLAAAMPLSNLATSPCAPDNHPLTPIIITYQGQISPDVACAADPRESALYDDAQAVVHALYVANYRSRAVSHFATANQAAAPVPASQPAPAPPPPAPSGMGGYGHK